MKKIDGIVPVMLTPFTEQNDVDYPGLANLIDWYLENKVDALFAVCQSSEMQFLTLEERVAVARFVVDHVKGRVPVIASGHISDDLGAQIEELSAMAQTGIDALVLVTNHLDPQKTGSDTFFSTLNSLLEALPASLPLGLYECPAPYRRLLSDEELTYCANTGRFVVLKDVSCDLDTVTRRVKLVQDTPLNIINANAAIAFPAMKAGSRGFSGVFTNFHPELYVWLKLYRNPTPAEEVQIHGEAEAAETQQANQPKASWGSLFKHKTTWFMILGNFSIMFTIWVYLTWLPSYLERSLGFSLMKTGWVASIPFFAGIMGVLVGGVISDRLIRRGTNTITARKIPIVCGAALAACFVAPIPFVHDTTLCIALLSLGYFCSQMPSGVIWTLATDIAPKSQVASLGAIQNFGGFLGAASAPIVTGIILDATGTFTNVFLFGAFLLMLGAISYGFFVKKPIQAAV